MNKTLVAKELLAIARDIMSAGKKKMKTITRKCSECGVRFKQEVEDTGRPLTTDDYDEYCEECNQKAMR